MYPTGFVDRFSRSTSRPSWREWIRRSRPCTPTGPLRRLSRKDFFGVDYATKAGQFDMKTIGQVVK